MSNKSKPKAKVWKAGYGSHQHPAIFFQAQNNTRKVEYLLTYNATANDLFEIIQNWSANYELEFVTKPVTEEEQEDDDFPEEPTGSCFNPSCRKYLYNNKDFCDEYCEEEYENNH